MRSANNPCHGPCPVMNHHRSPAHLVQYLAATILPLVLFTVSLFPVIRDKALSYSQAEREIQGSDTLDLLFLDLTTIQQIRGLSQMTDRSPSVDRKIHKRQQELLARLRLDRWRKYSRLFGFAAEARELEKHILFLMNRHQEGMTSGRLFSEYTRLTGIILQLMKMTADQSHLILDPDMDTHYLIDILVDQIPSLSEAIGRFRGMGAGLLSQESVSPLDAQRLSGYRSVIESRLETLRREEKILRKIAPALADKLELFPGYLAQDLDLLWRQSLILEGKSTGSRMSPEIFFARATKAIESLFPTYRQGIVLLTSRLKERKRKQLLQAILITGASLGAIFLLLMINRNYYRKNRALQERLASLSITDQLTGLYNRRHLEEIFPGILRTASRHEQHLYLVSLDVDHFKRYNDRYGHPAGDRALQQVAQTMRKVFRRENDHCFRIGGEEFGILFTTRTQAGARRIVERLRQQIQELAITHEGNPPWKVVTVSLGLFPIPDDPHFTLDQALIRVDRALYRAKDEGRNRVAEAS